MTSSKLSDYISIDLLQSIQDNCALATGVALVTVDFRGVPLTRYSNFTQHCLLMREDPAAFALCKQCDAYGGLRATMSSEPCFYRCHCGLVDFAIPFVVDGVYLGAMLGGQVRMDSPTSIDAVLPLGVVTSSAELELVRKQTPVITQERLNAVIDTVRDLVLYAIRISEDQNTFGEMSLLKTENEELKAQYEDLTQILRRVTVGSQRSDEILSNFYFFMNIIRMLALEEGAQKTNQATLDYANAVRYMIDTISPVTTLGEEIDFTEALLRVLKAWYGDVLTFDISLLSALRPTPCPFMTFLPIVKLGIAGISEQLGHEREISIQASRIKEHVRVTVSVNALLSDKDAALTDEHKGSAAFTLSALNRTLRKLNAHSSGIQITDNGSSPGVSQITFELPLMND